MRDLGCVILLAAILPITTPVLADTRVNDACHASFLECFNRSLDQVRRKVGLEGSQKPQKVVKPAQKAPVTPVAIPPGSTTAL